MDALGPGVSRYGSIDVPTLLLVGAASPDRQRRNCEALARALPRMRIESLDGLGHVAHNAAPDQVAVLAGRFLDGD